MDREVHSVIYKNGQRYQINLLATAPSSYNALNQSLVISYTIANVGTKRLIGTLGLRLNLWEVQSYRDVCLEPCETKTFTYSYRITANDMVLAQLLLSASVHLICRKYSLGTNYVSLTITNDNVAIFGQTGPIGATGATGSMGVGFTGSTGATGPSAFSDPLFPRYAEIYLNVGSVLGGRNAPLTMGPSTTGAFNYSPDDGLVIMNSGGAGLYAVDVTAYHSTGALTFNINPIDNVPISMSLSTRTISSIPLVVQLGDSDVGTQMSLNFHAFTDTILTSYFSTNQDPGPGSYAGVVRLIQLRPITQYP